jgi:D-3-phosphoglycerate dehydrogenase
MSLRVLFADRLDAGTVARLEDMGHEVVVVPDASTADLPDLVGDVDVLVVRSTRVDQATLEAGGRLDLVVRAGAGTDTIDVEAASRNGIVVCNVPGRYAVAVAELTFGLLLAIDRDIVDASNDLRAGRWRKSDYSGAQGLLGRRIAVLGLGEIGLAVAERASAFGMEVVALRRPGRDTTVLSRVRAAGIRFVDSLEELLSESSVVSIHVPSGPDTEKLVDHDFLALLPDGAIVLNTSRGEIVDEEALLEALDHRGFRAGLDVYRDEPAGGRADWGSPLAAHPRVTGSHHIGASTLQAQHAVAEGVLEVIEAFAAGEVPSCVNLARRPLGTCSMVVRHRDEVGVLAAALTCLREGGINVQQMQNRIFAGDNAAAVATIRLSAPPGDALVERVRSIEAVIDLRVRMEA